jgi:branched-chain amino acid aminotransferase
LALPSPEVYSQGVALVTTTAQRQAPSLKTTNFINESQAERKNIAGTSAYEGLIMHHQRIMEGLTSNFFYVWAGALGTAGRGVLPGITRGEILDIARKSLSIPIRFRALRIEQAQFIQEAFICSSSREIVPVVNINDARIGSGKVGTVTQKLIKAYKQSVMQRSETFI